MTNNSLALQGAETHVAMYEKFGSEVFDIEDHNNAMDCLNCESFIQMGIDSYEWLINSDQTIRKAIFTGQIEHNSEIDSILEALFIRWLEPCKIANDWTETQCERGYALSNLELFRRCEAEVRAIVSSFGESNDMPIVIQDLQDMAEEDHANGETSEFV